MNKGLASILATLLFLAVAAGCTAFVRATYVPSGTPVRIRKTIKDAPVWVLDTDGNPVAATMDIPEGWYALPLPEEAGNE